MGEIYHVAMTLIFWETIWPARNASQSDAGGPTLRFDFFPSVDIFIPTAGEPVDIVKNTLEAAKKIRYKGKKTIYILNDGFVAKKDNWRDIQKLAKNLNVSCLTRIIPGGAKAGNINNALNQTSGEIVVIFDADMVSYPEFLEKTINYFVDKNVAFVQTPQFYKNAGTNLISRASWEQQAFFFGPIMRGKEKDNSVFICGTNVAIRRSALVEIGGFVTNNIAEDFATSIKIHQRGYRSIYVPKILAAGLAPEDLGSYLKQQLRWTRGNIETFLYENVFFKRGLSLRQKIQYFSSSAFFLGGLFVLIDMIIPVIFLFTSLQPVTAATTTFALFFIPFMFLNIYTLYISSNSALTFRAISFTQSSWNIQIFALVSALLKIKMGFVVTPKTAQKNNYISLAFPHIAYILLAAIGTAFALHREGLNPPVATNLAWVIFNIVMFVPFIKAAYD
ncbi:glycosyltransferase [Candidatus Microgenomates bacterium]|nr:glycosyltransferase [Candidatus Microgenomates bacterium]